MSEDTQDRDVTAALESEGDADEQKMEGAEVNQDRNETALESEGDVDELKMEEAEIDQPTPKKERPRVQGIGEILEGKRTKKTVERLETEISIPKEKLRVENGGGDKLGDIPRTNFHISKMKPMDLKPLHVILFDRPGKTSILKKNMRLFNGFTFEVDSEPYIRKRERMLRKGNTSFSNAKLKVICRILDLEQKGSQPEVIDRILSFLIRPRNSKKPPKKNKSKKKLSGSDSDAKTKRTKKSPKKRKPKPRSTSASPKKAKSGSKSKAIVMDLSSDDDEDDKKVEVTLDSMDSDSEKKPMEEKDKSKDSDDSDDGDKEKDEAEPKKKNAAKRATTTKPVAQTKKADSSSNRKKTTSTVTEDSSDDDDEPLIKMIKKAPSDEQLIETVQKLLKEANLEEMTMKQICQKVYDTYPDHDLTSRKDYIKQTVKTLIT